MAALSLLPGLRGTHGLRAGGGGVAQQPKPLPCQPCPTSESPNQLREVLAQQQKDAPQFPHTLAWDTQVPEACPQHLWGGREVGPREARRGRNPRASSWSGQGAGAQESYGTPGRTSDIGGRAVGIGLFGTRSWQGLGQGRARSPWWGGGHWLWHRYQAPVQVLSAIRAAGTPSCLPSGRSRGQGGNVPNMAFVLRASREQRVQAASRAGGPADDNLFHGSYAYGTAPASESTRTFPRNKQ